MSLDNTKLLDFLGEIDKEPEHRIVIVAVGGTAMTLECQTIHHRCIKSIVQASVYWLILNTY
ncbi:MAG TPA: hypothetical protein VGA92_05040 [Candidatus Nitrosotenuis sp.]